MHFVNTTKTIAHMTCLNLAVQYTYSFGESGRQCSLNSVLTFMLLNYECLWNYLLVYLFIHHCWAWCLWVIIEQTKLMTFFPKETSQPWGCVRLYYTDTVSQPSLEGSLYESISVMLWQFNLCEQCDAISQPALLTMWITVSLYSV